MKAGTESGIDKSQGNQTVGFVFGVGVVSEWYPCAQVERRK